MQSVDVKGALCLIGRTSLVGEIRRAWFEVLSTRCSGNTSKTDEIAEVNEDVAHGGGVGDEGDDAHRAATDRCPLPSDRAIVWPLSAALP
jgi:hypothetical protein